MEDLKHIISVKHWQALSRHLFPCECKICRQTSAELVCKQCQANLHLPPDVCHQCGESLANRRIQAKDTVNHCGTCISQPPAYSKTIFAFTYAGVAARLVQQFKFKEDLILTQFLAQHICEQVITQCTSQALPDVLIPIPLHAKRLKERGFNQSLELAKHIGRQLNIPVFKHCLKRKRATSQQSGLNRKARQRNIQGAFDFSCPKPAREMYLKNKHIAIVDDVITTGATVREAAKVLKRAAPGNISVYAIAKTQQDTHIR